MVDEGDAQQNVWTRYPKMAESTQSFTTLPIGEWIVTEKIHGANFSVVANGSGTWFAKRSGELPVHEDFYGFRSAGLSCTLSACAHRLLHALRRTGAVDSVCVFGELCGGHYPHPEVPAVPGTMPVQRGVWYSPGLDFVAFDVRVCERGVDETVMRRRFLDFAEARHLALQAGFHFVEALAKGSLQACLDEPIRFSSRVPSMLRLPMLPELGMHNLAEGVVVRMAREAVACESAIGSKGKGGARMMFKRKIAQFSEKQYQNEGWRDARDAVGGGGGPSQAELVRWEMLAAVSEPRLAAVASKVGRISLEDRAACRALLDLFQQDVIEALVADGCILPGETLSQSLAAELEAAARPLVARWLRAQAAPLTAD
jgi:Rnl2 family RNA ligase